MSIMKTYRRALAALAAALAIALAGVGVAPASAWGSVTESVLGIALDVPSTVEQAPGVGGDGGAGSVLGVNVKVPSPVGGDSDQPGGNSSETSGATGVLGINLNVPSTVEQTPGSGTGGGTESILGVNLKVPSPVEEAPDAPGANTPGAMGGAGSVLGINLNVPSTVDQVAGAGGGTESVLGVELKVPVGNFVSFNANGGSGAHIVQIDPVTGVAEFDWRDHFSWPGRHIVGWYATSDCSGMPVVDYSSGSAVGFPIGDMLGGEVLYAKWVVDDPRAVGTVTLHLVESRATIEHPGDFGINADSNDWAEAGSPAGYVLKGTEDGLPEGEQAQLYEGRYFPGGDGSVFPGDDPNEGGTLALPIPEMTGRDEDRDGTFVGWYRSCEVDAATGERVYAGRVEGDAIGKFETGDQELWAKWDIRVTHPFTFDANGGAFAGGESALTQRVPDGERAVVPADPVREGYTFDRWCTDAACTSYWSASSRVYGPTTVYARWSEDAPDPPDRPDSPAGKLDVTVPVSVTFAVNADTGEVLAPEMGAYALKSRSAVPVAVERLDAETLEAEAGQLLSLAEGAAGWGGALRSTELLFRAEGDPSGLAVPLAGAGGEGSGGAWAGSYELAAAERDAWYTIEAFDPASGDAGEEWWLADACNRLPLELGMRLSGLLEVRHGVAGPVPVTHLKVTVSARP